MTRRPPPAPPPFTPLPAPGTPVVTTVRARRRRGVWSLDRDGDREFVATWRYPTVGLWRRIDGRGVGFPREEEIWRYALVGASFLDRVDLDGDRIAEVTYRAILDFVPAMIPAALVRSFSDQITLPHAEMLRIERECYSLWTSRGGGIRNPHPLLGEVVWAMSLYEKFGIQSWGRLDDLHVKTYAVMRKTLECYSQAQEINAQAVLLRQRAQRESGVGPGGAYGFRKG